MKRKHTKRDRLLYIVVLLIALFPLGSLMLYVLGFNLGFVGFLISLPFIILGLGLLLLKYLILRHNDIRADKEYTLGDDGEIIEITDDQKPKRSGDSAVQ